MLELTHVSKFYIAKWDELDQTDQELLQRAIEVRRRARVSVSHFKVGAAMRSKKGKIFGGCNVEDIAHTGTIHAEAGALATMMATADLDEMESVAAVAIALGMEDVEITCPPQLVGAAISATAQITNTVCGHCRTVISQYALEDASTRVIALQPNGEILITTIGDLYPLGFSFLP